MLCCCVILEGNPNLQAPVANESRAYNKPFVAWWQREHHQHAVLRHMPVKKQRYTTNQIRYILKNWETVWHTVGWWEVVSFSHVLQAQQLHTNCHHVAFHQIQHMPLTQEWNIEPLLFFNLSPAVIAWLSKMCFIHATFANHTKVLMNNWTMNEQFILKTYALCKVIPIRWLKLIAKTLTPLTLISVTVDFCGAAAADQRVRKQSHLSFQQEGVSCLSTRLPSA